METSNAKVPSARSSAFPIFIVLIICGNRYVVAYNGRAAPTILESPVKIEEAATTPPTATGTLAVIVV